MADQPRRSRTCDYLTRLDDDFAGSKGHSVSGMPFRRKARRIAGTFGVAVHLIRRP
jgi:hypothetical protein